jgi:hypothetical protein
MKKKGFTRKSIAKASAPTAASASATIAGPSTPLSSTLRTSSSMQVDWVNSISSGDVEMKDSHGLVSHFTFPAFTIISDQDFQKRNVKTVYLIIYIDFPSQNNVLLNWFPYRYIRTFPSSCYEWLSLLVNNRGRLYTLVNISSTQIQGRCLCCLGYLYN